MASVGGSVDSVISSDTMSSVSLCENDIPGSSLDGRNLWTNILSVLKCLTLVRLPFLWIPWIQHSILHFSDHNLKNVSIYGLVTYILHQITTAMTAKHHKMKNHMWMSEIGLTFVLFLKNIEYQSNKCNHLWIQIYKLKICYKFHLPVLVLQVKMIPKLISLFIIFFCNK